MRLRSELVALRHSHGRALKQLSSDQRDTCLIEGGDPEIMADVSYLRDAPKLLLLIPARGRNDSTHAEGALPNHTQLSLLLSHSNRHRWCISSY